MLYWFSAWPHCLILVTFLVLRRLEEESSIDLGRDRIASLAAVVGILSFDARGLGASGLMLYWLVAYRIASLAVVEGVRNPEYVQL